MNGNSSATGMPKMNSYSPGLLSRWLFIIQYLAWVSSQHSHWLSRGELPTGHASVHKHVLSFCCISFTDVPLAKWATWPSLELMWEGIRQRCEHRKMVHWRPPCNSLPQGWFLSLATHGDLLVSIVLQELNPRQCLPASTYRVQDLCGLVLITVLHFGSVSDTWKYLGS